MYRPDKFKTSDPFVPYGPDVGGRLHETLMTGEKQGHRLVATDKMVATLPTFNDVEFLLKDGRTLTFEVMSLPVSASIPNAPLSSWQYGDLFLPVTAEEQRDICVKYGWLPLTASIVAQALRNPTTWVFLFEPYVSSPEQAKYMKSIAFSAALAENFREKEYERLREEEDPQEGITFGPWKWWILNARSKSVNFGACKNISRREWWQNPGAMHGIDHYDYSQVLQVMKNSCLFTVDDRSVERIDLTTHPEVFELTGEVIPASILEWYRHTV